MPSPLPCPRVLAITLVFAACSRAVTPPPVPPTPTETAPDTAAAAQDQAPPGQAPGTAPQAPTGTGVVEPARITLLVDPGAEPPQPVNEAIAVLQPTKESHVRGTVRFRDIGNGTLEVFAAVDALPGGTHAYHVHVFGDCSSPDAESAGPHFHFTGSSFDKHVKIITGNLGELRDDGRLTTTHQATIDASLQGRFSILGRAVVVHAQGNDPKVTPDGGAGRRLACGVIGIANPNPAQQTAAKTAKP